VIRRAPETARNRKKNLKKDNETFMGKGQDGFMTIRFLASGILALFVGSAVAEELALKPDDLLSARFVPVKAPAYTGLLLQTGDRLAIIGDSITEHKIYSRILETYLTVCVPELKITARQFGYSGETAERFLQRMTNDCLRFHPTIATLSYGMNDYKYRPYDEGNASWYRNNYTAVAQAFKANGARVVMGSPGCVGKVASWVKSATGTVDEHNLHLYAFRNIDIEIADQEQIRFADVFWPMFAAGLEARQMYGTNYAIAGQDGVHPGWAGNLIMAYAYLTAMGLGGDIGTFTVDLEVNSATVTDGHTLDSFTNNILTITSRRYPFCATGGLNDDNSIRSGMAFVPFNESLNRLQLVVRNGKAANYQVTWGSETRTYPAAQLTAGVNLAADFITNPFSEAFGKVDEAVAKKQDYETRQIKQMFHSPEGLADADATAALTEEVRQPLANAIAKAFVPVTHTIRIEPE
jgi:lysophospholipase L1-like esterase